ncbi:MAG: hypothetical protein P8Y53_11040 [Pseudolabrys sp.]
MSDIDTAVVDTLKALDPERPIREVTEYWADYWLLDVEKRGSYNYLVYNQVILMEMDIYQGKGSIADPKSFRRYVFPHVTANTVARIGKNPADGKKQTGGCNGC